jgi:hypothetical protein
MRLMHQFHHEIKMDEQKMNNFVNIPFYRYNLHFRGRQKILGSPMDQRQIQNEKNELQGAPTGIKYHNAFMDLP